MQLQMHVETFAMVLQPSEVRGDMVVSTTVISSCDGPMTETQIEFTPLIVPRGVAVMVTVVIQ